MIRRLALLCFAFAIGIVAYFVLDTWRFERLPLAGRLEELWADDLEQLESTNALPKAWSQIREVDLSAGNDESRDFLKKVHIPISLNKKGRYKLLILLVTWSEGPKNGAFIQYDLEDLESPVNNTVWELSRGLILADKGLWYAPYFHRSVTSPASKHP